MTLQRTSLSIADDDLLDKVHLKAYPIDTHLDTLYLTRVGGYDFWKGDWKTEHEPLSIKIIKRSHRKERTVRIASMSVAKISSEAATAARVSALMLFGKTSFPFPLPIPGNTGGIIATMSDVSLQKAGVPCA